MKKPTMYIAATLACLLCSTSLLAQETPPAETEDAQEPRLKMWKGNFRIGFITTGTTDKAVADHGVERGFGLHMGGGAVLFEIASLSLDFGVQSHKDDKSFSQSVAAQYSTDVSQAESSLTSFFFSVGLGARTPVFNFVNKLAVQVGAEAGYTFVMWGKRQIDNCSDCRVDHFLIGSGFYIEPFLAFPLYYLKHSHGGMGFEVSYRHYLQDQDIFNMLIFSFVVS